MKTDKQTWPRRMKSAVAGAVSGWLGREIQLTDGDFWRGWLGNNFSGQRVTVNSTLQLSTAMACVRLLSEVISTLPFGLYEKDKNGTPIAASDHQLYYLIHTQPNADMTASTFWQVFMASMLLHGYARVEKRMAGRTITSLIPLVPECISRRRIAPGVYEWHYNDPILGTSRVIAPANQWEVPAFTLNGIDGLSPIAFGANVFGAALAADKASAETFTNGLKSPGLVMMDSVLKPEQREDIRQHVDKVQKTGSVMVMEKGAGFQQLKMNPQDAELLSTRKFNIEEICRWYRVDPSLVGHGGKDSNWGTGLEEKMTWLVTLAMRPWAVKLEQAIRKDLLRPEEKRRYYAEISLEGLLRGDSKARAAFYSQMVQNGIMTRDECRRLENLPVHGGQADALTVQSNLLPIDQLGLGADGATQVRQALNAWLSRDKVTEP
ncbi:phage portal protein [Herbaspirillum sp. 1130]|uniref:phage portal protein n=1 Tax=Herbaspirillum sp. 1130 TaxID=2806562 RepID=UPI001AE6B6F1|nr:phage portal protein [Herbaspirillum sp. 1130]MBP1314446.1 HK97 family phage portal protein [Herbaspirillum sp. 1130]